MATIEAQHRARPTLSATHLLALLGIALKTVAPEPFELIAIDSPADARLDVLENLLERHRTGISEIVLNRQNSFTSARRFLVPQVLLSAYFAQQDEQEVRFADFGTGLGILPRQLNAAAHYQSFAADLIWPHGIPAFRKIPLVTRQGVDRGPLPDLDWVRACYGQSEYYAELYNELLCTLEVPAIKDADVRYQEIDLLNSASIAEFIHQHKINVANLSYVLYELERGERSAIVEMLARELHPPAVLLVSEPHKELHAQGSVVEFFHSGETTPQTLCFVTDGHYKGFVLPLEDYDAFIKRYPIAYTLARCAAMKSIYREGRRRGDVDNFSLGSLVPRWLAVLIGLMGSILGLATNLYSDQFRGAITTSTRHIGDILFPVLASVVASGSALVIYRLLLNRRREQSEILRGELHIGSDALDSVADDHDVIVGRSLHYLETKRVSDDLLVFLHGLGLDANDFRPYMAESRFHCLALTLYGFNTEEKEDPHYRPISLQSHVQLVGYALGKIAAMYPRKRITLVGFSFGADIVFFLMQFAAQATRELKIRRAVLLDPNINHSTTTISSRIADVNKDEPLTELVKILESANNAAEFRNLCHYLYKITSKNLAQIQRHAKEVIALLDTSAYDQFLDRMGQLSSATDGINVVLSFDYEEHFNAIARGAVTRGMDIQSLECSRVSHFDLIETSFLKDRLEGVLSAPTGI
jgi:pimeloyl-ACP methyl ester carboxylesterase